MRSPSPSVIAARTRAWYRAERPRRVRRGARCFPRTRGTR